MQVYFNDLTLAPTAAENGVFLSEFLDLKKEFFAVLKAQKKDCGAILIANKEGLSRLCEAFCNRPELMPYFQSCVGLAFQEDSERDADHLLETQYTMEGPQQQKMQYDMMGLAHKENSFTLGINSSKFWQDLVYPIEKETFDGSEEVNAICVTRKRQIQSEAVRNQIKMSDGGYKVAEEGIAASSSGKRVVVVGVHDRGMLLEVLRGLHVDPRRFEFIETGELKNYDITRWRNTNSIVALMIGAVPHKAAGMGDATSVLDALKKHPGYPHVETLTETMVEKEDPNTGIKQYVATGELNVTKNSFRCGLMNLMNLGLI